MNKLGVQVPVKFLRLTHLVLRAQNATADRCVFLLQDHWYGTSVASASGYARLQRKHVAP